MPGLQIKSLPKTAPQRIIEKHICKTEGKYLLYRSSRPFVKAETVKCDVLEASSFVCGVIVRMQKGRSRVVFEMSETKRLLAGLSNLWWQYKDV